MAWLIDAASYYAALAEVITRAKSSILIVGWDIHTQVKLVPHPKRLPLPATLREMLDAAVARTPTLHAHVLTWDYSPIYIAERQWFPRVRLGRTTHPRLHFELDGAHPIFASHHQKIVVVDDRIAFVGSTDLALVRWDTSAHAPHDPRRKDPEGKPYPPMHEVQVMVDGEAAKALGRLVRERWARATGEQLEPPTLPAENIWPPAVKSDAETLDVGIARTMPRFKDFEEVREIEQLNIDAIAAARRYIYIENQYFTSRTVCRALSSVLRRKDGPEVVILLPGCSSGWLEQLTMDVLRARVLRPLRRADRYGRLRIYYPRHSGLTEHYINLHSKVMVVDDCFARVGSSNLSNRSMGLDTECDLVLNAGPDSEECRAVSRLRDRLLCEHLGQSIGELERTLAETGSLIAAIERLRGRERSLEPLDEQARLRGSILAPILWIIDSDRPLTLQRILRFLNPWRRRRRVFPQPLMERR